MAVRLEMVLGVPARFWNNLEAIYREKIIKAEAENAMDADAEIAGKFPYAEMAEYGWIPKTKNINEKVINLRKYFGVVSLSLLGNAQITRIACRRLAVSEKRDLALLAWTQEARIKARDIHTASKKKDLQSVLPAIRAMTLLEPEQFCSRIIETLAECGIALVFLPHLKGSFLQEATFIDGNKIVVGMTARGWYADKFWYSLFHELGHIVLSHTEKLEGITEEDEETADQWAMDILIERNEFEIFKNKSDYTETSVRQFALSQGIASGIVVGRMRRKGIIRYSQLNQLKEKYVIEA